MVCFCRWFVAAVCAAVVAGCGGGGGDDGSAGSPPVAGLWSGTTNTGRTFAGVTLNDGSYWVLYSVAGNPSLIAGVVQGTGTYSGNTFTSSNARDYYIEGSRVLSASAQATVTAGQSFAGTITYSNGPVSFNSTYNSAFDAAPSLASLAGSYSGSVASPAGVQSAAATVSSNGAFSA
jgi:hypothetical protein